MDPSTPITGITTNNPERLPKALSQNSLSQIRLYIKRQASGTARYLWEQTVLGLFGWIPTLIGITIRAVIYRLILKINGPAAIEKGVRIRFAGNVTLGRGAYIDQAVYLHACPNGIRIGDKTLVMHGSVLHVYNFRGIPHSGIQIGNHSLIGEYNVIRGQGGVRIGNRVYTSPMVQIVAVNHIFEDPNRSFVEQGITARGITIEDDVWIGSGAVITDGVTIGKGSVIAAGSIVIHDVEPHTVVAGNPARFIRRIGDSQPHNRHDTVYFEE
jgi:acetyltransferase-like isoleucine patch superfamily enzyme